MSNREALLEGAKRCLIERGYARTTARDVVAASGTNLASIGYHFGSMQALLNAAMIAAIEEWGATIGQLIAADSATSVSPAEQFEATWTRIIESFAAQRSLWAATVEVVVQAEHEPEVRAFLADALQQGREGLTTLFQYTDAPADEQTVRTVGSLYQALVTGVMVQWLVDPQRAPTGHDLATALRAIVARMQAPVAGDDADSKA